LYMSSQFYSERRAKLPPFRIILRTLDWDRPIVIGPFLAQLSGEAKLRQADIG
jgi:hypothetical protein